MNSRAEQTEAPMQGEERCKSCDSPIDPGSGRSLYEFDVNVPLGELREALAAAEQRERELQAQVDELEAATAWRVPAWDLIRKREAERDEARAECERLKGEIDADHNWVRQDLYDEKLDENERLRRGLERLVEAAGGAQIGDYDNDIFGALNEARQALEEARDG